MRRRAGDKLCPYNFTVTMFQTEPLPYLKTAWYRWRTAVMKKSDQMVGRLLRLMLVFLRLLERKPGEALHGCHLRVVTNLRSNEYP